MRALLNILLGLNICSKSGKLRVNMERTVSVSLFPSNSKRTFDTLDHSHVRGEDEHRLSCRDCQIKFGTISIPVAISVGNQLYKYTRNK